MFEKILYLFAGGLGIIIFLLMVFRFKNNRNINIYFIALAFLGSLRFLSYGLSTNVAALSPQSKLINYLFSLCVWPLFYLYFKKIVQIHAVFKKRDALHFLAPIIITSFIAFKNYFNVEFYTTVVGVCFVFSLALSVVYAIVCYRFLRKNIWNRSSDILVINQQNKLIKQWTKIIYTVSIIMLIRFLLNVAMNNDLLWFKNQKDYLWISAFCWIGIYVKMLIYPEILYGYDIFQKKINDYKKSAIVFNHIWITSGKQVVNIQDAALKEKIVDSIQNYIIAIELLAINTDLFLKDDFTINDLVNKLNAPKSHVVYLFKYHCTISFVDFKKIIRVQKAVLLIEEGFLKSNTLEALAVRTGFSSYSPFFKSFKSITGMSPKDYLK
jgi:AraC-like DNA-binding protein